MSSGSETEASNSLKISPSATFPRKKSSKTSQAVLELFAKSAALGGAEIELEKR